MFYILDGYKSRCCFAQVSSGDFCNKKVFVGTGLLAEKQNLHPCKFNFFSHDKQFAELKCIQLDTLVFRNKSVKFCHLCSQSGITYSLSSTHLKYSFGGLIGAIKKSSGIQASSPLIAHYFVFCCIGENRDVISR